MSRQFQSKSKDLVKLSVITAEDAWDFNTKENKNQDYLRNMIFMVKLKKILQLLFLKLI